MSKHTPLPWNYGEGYIDTHAVDDDGSVDYIILAELRSTFGPDDYGVDQWILPPEEREANGCLMAAAPEMYELIVQVADLHNPRFDGAAYIELVTEMDRLADLAQELLAKIEGGGE